MPDPLTLARRISLASALDGYRAGYEAALSGSSPWPDPENPDYERGVRSGYEDGHRARVILRAMDLARALA